MPPLSKKKKNELPSSGDDESELESLQAPRSPSHFSAKGSRRASPTRQERYDHHTVREALGLGGGRQKRSKTHYTVAEDMAIIKYLCNEGVTEYEGAFSGYAVMMGFSLAHPEVGDLHTEQSLHGRVRKIRKSIDDFDIPNAWKDLLRPKRMTARPAKKPAVSGSFKVKKESAPKEAKKKDVSPAAVGEDGRENGAGTSKQTTLTQAYRKLASKKSEEPRAKEVPRRQYPSKKDALAFDSEEDEVVDSKKGVRTKSGRKASKKRVKLLTLCSSEDEDNGQDVEATKEEEEIEASVGRVAPAMKSTKRPLVTSPFFTPQEDDNVEVEEDEASLDLDLDTVPSTAVKPVQSAFKLPSLSGERGSKAPAVCNLSDADKLLLPLASTSAPTLSTTARSRSSSPEIPLGGGAPAQGPLTFTQPVSSTPKFLRPASPLKASGQLPQEEGSMTKFATNISPVKSVRSVRPDSSTDDPTKKAEETTASGGPLTEDRILRLVQMFARYHKMTGKEAAWALFINNGSPMQTIKWLVEKGMNLRPESPVTLEIDRTLLREGEAALEKLAALGQYPLDELQARLEFLRVSQLDLSQNGGERQMDDILYHLHKHRFTPPSLD